MKNMIKGTVVVVDDDSMDRVKDAIKKGAAGFVVKPLETANVLGNIAACFKDKH